MCSLSDRIQEPGGGRLGPRVSVHTSIRAAASQSIMDNLELVATRFVLAMYPMSGRGDIDYEGHPSWVAVKADAGTGLCVSILPVSQARWGFEITLLPY